MPLYNKKKEAPEPDSPVVQWKWINGKLGCFSDGSVQTDTAPAASASGGGSTATACGDAPRVDAPRVSDVSIQVSLPPHIYEHLDPCFQEMTFRRYESM